MRRTAFVFGVWLCVAPPVHAQRPLYIINGVRVETCGSTFGGDRLSRLGDIDPATIDNIEVLKGPAAAAAYGPDALNGVITISTRKGAVISPRPCGAPAPAGADPFGKYLYSPELVMAHQEAIGLTDRQRAAIQDAVKEIQSRTTDAQFRLSLAAEKLAHSLARTSVDEAAVLQQVDEVLMLEREVKRGQVTLLVRIKNQLSAEQQGVLDKAR
jgi:TonB-dependent SusC/RagA subfamily outer membrane receptor